MTPPPNTFNKFVVASGAGEGAGIVILNLPLQARPIALASAGGAVDEGSSGLRWPAVAPLTTEEALNLAAWLVAVTGERAAFDQLLDAIEAT